MDKFKCYHYLLKIKKTENININEQVELIAGKEEVPLSVVKFINKYYPQQQITTLEHIHSKRHKNPLYKNLVNENLNVEDKAIALSSLLTQTMIGLKNIDDDSKEDYCKTMMTEEILDAINSYSTGDTDKLLEVSNNIRNKIKEIY